MFVILVGPDQMLLFSFQGHRLNIYMKIRLLRITNAILLFSTICLLSGIFNHLFEELVLFCLTQFSFMLEINSIAWFLM